MEDQGQTPSGSMKWNPTAPAYAIYEKCIELYKEYSIMMTFYYVTGKSITFEFFWAGQVETYGKDMDITVKLVSLMDGLINANFYATVQADKEEKGKNYKDSVTGLMKQYGIEGIPFRAPFIRYTKQAEKDLSEAIVKNSYNDGSTFMDAMQNLVKDNGNYVFFNNIESANATVFGPYTYECEGLAEGERLIVFPPLSRKSPDPTQRYVYVIGPNIIQSFTRTMEWQPPQKSQEISAILARKKEEEKERKKKKKKGERGSNPQVNQQVTSDNATAPSGVYGAKNTSNIRSEKNTMGPIKQDMFTKEKTAKLALTTFMCPYLVGIKPLDIIFIPSYSTNYVQDWIVNSVEYQQTQGGVDVAIQATRVYGSGDPMCPEDVEFARENLQLSNVLTSGNNQKTATLEQWETIAWDGYLGIPDDLTPPSSTPSPTSTTQMQSQQTSTSGNFWRDAGYSSLEGYINGEYPVGKFQQIVSVTPTAYGPLAKYNDPVFLAYSYDRSLNSPGVIFKGNESIGLSSDTLLTYYNDYIGSEQGETTKRELAIQSLESQGKLETLIKEFRALTGRGR